MERKLAEYRARKRKEEILADATAAKSSLPSVSPNIMPAVSNDASVEDIPSDTESLMSSTSSDKETSYIGLQSLSQNDLIVYTISVVFWITVYVIAIYLEFGTVYFVVSMLFLIWKNTRTGPKKENEISAYSVFNPNCEAIDGTLKAEQFEREIRYGPGSVR